MNVERMTYWCDDGKGGGEWRANVRGTEVLGAEIDRLAAYEDTGLEPEEIEEIRGEMITRYDESGAAYQVSADGSEAKHGTNN